MEPTPHEGAMPPRTKSAVQVRGERRSLAAPSAPRPQLLRRASMAALPQADDLPPSGPPGARPGLRRGASFVPRNRSSVSFASNVHAPMPPRGPALDHAPSAAVGPPGERPAAPPAVCGMCGGCGEGLRAMPPWAPERLAKGTPEERRRALLQLHEREEMGKISSAVRAQSVKASPAPARAARATPPGPRPLRRAPSKGPLAALTRAASGAGPMMGREASVDLVEKRGPRRAPKAVDPRLTGLGMTRMESIDLGSGEANEVEAFRNDGKRSKPADELEEFGGDEEIPLDVAAGRSTALEAFAADVYAAEESVLDIDCAQCDDLEARVVDLEEQLGVLREVVKISAGDADNRRVSETGSLDEAMKAKQNLNKNWKDRLVNTYFGANGNTAAERAKLKAEVDALRKATNFLFSKLQESDDKRAVAKMG